MTRIIYVNGEYQPYDQALIHVEDRGFQFADGVYEVCEVRDHRLVDEPRHMVRLERSLKELRMKIPMSSKALGIIMRETIRRNRVRNGLVYLQVTRGVQRRDFAYPPENHPRSVICLARSTSPFKAEAAARQGITVITTPDIRWKRPDIKTVGLLPAAMGRQEAIDVGAQEAWFYDEHGFITEGASCNAWIVDLEGNLITRSAEFGILRGITRSVVFDLAEREGVKILERSFSIEEVKQAREAFVTSATSVVMPVIQIDQTKIGDGTPGPISLKMRNLFHTQAEIA